MKRTIIILLILAGVSLNAIVGDNGVITNAQKAKIEAEEAELWEKVQMVLVEGMGQDLDREKYVDEVNNKFKNQGLEAKIGLRADGYAVTYGKYSRKVALLSDDLQILGEIVAIEGNSDLWTSETKEDGTLKLTGYKGEKEGDIQIPNIIDGKFVTEIGTIFQNANNITKLNIPEGIEKIDNQAFLLCTSLDCEIIFPSSLKEIGESAFYGCVGIKGDLNSIVSQGIKTGKNAFAKCSKMTGDIKVLIDTLPDDVKEIESEKFSGFSGVTGTLVIPARITKIGDNAFSKCSGLTEIEFESESKLTEIGNYAFSECKGISEELDIPNSVTSIGEYAFYSCTSLESLKLSSGLTNIGEYAFYNCSSLSGDLTIPTGVNIINASTFTSTSFSNVVFASGDGQGENLVLSGQCFQSVKCKKVVLPNDRCVEVGSLAFWGCKTENIENSNKIISVSTGSFRETGNLSTIDLTGLTTMDGNGLFENGGLTILPNLGKIDKLKNSTFIGCSKLKENVVEYLSNSSISKVGDGAFSNCSGVYGEIVNNVIKNKNGEKITLGGAVFSGTKVTKVAEITLKDEELDLNHETTISENQFSGVTKFKNGEKEIKKIKIPDSITSIGKNAFSGCSSITEVTIPRSVTNLGEGAFRECTSLEKITFEGESPITEIPDYCFYKCKLSNISLPDSVSKLGTRAFCGNKFTEIDLSKINTLGGWCFSGCSSLVNIKSFSSSLKLIPEACFEECGELCDFVVPDNVTALGSWAFQYCTFTEATFGTGITSIAASCFGGSGLKRVKFEGSVERIGDYAFLNCKKLDEIKLSWGNLKKIGNSAFSGCTSLTGDITLNTSCEYNFDNSFLQCPLNIKRE